MQKQITYDEAEQLGLTRRDTDQFNAFQAIAKMIADHLALTPKQRFEAWKETHLHELEKLGYTYIHLFSEETDYQYGIKTQNNQLHLFLTPHKAYLSEKPTISKAKLAMTIRIFPNWLDLYNWIAIQQYEKTI